MKKLLLGLVLVATAAGCKSNPYCLNCKDSGNGVITPEDMTSTGVDAGDAGEQLGPDMLGTGGPCGPTNGGIEICDGLDNDCNGKIDDVDPSKLKMDPKNCGACGNECKYPHAGGKCDPTSGTPTCAMDKCQPGYVDLDGNPANGCEYTCTPTSPATEICDGKDNNCDGTVDEGFTTTWFDAAKQMPKYDSLLADCGQCGTVCNLGPGTIMACQGTGANGRGQCAVVACFNGLDAMGNHQTYRHHTGNINVTGCEYHCPKPASTTGNDCNPNGACTFPVETCNGIDDDCDFTPDNNLTDPGLGGACPDGTPGKLCSGTQCDCNGHPGVKCVCAPGKLQCAGGGLSCDSTSVGPSPETCDVKDNDCDGKVDNGFTKTWTDAGNQIPAYDSDPGHCGSCGAAVCALPHGPNICRIAGGDTKGSCAIAACDPGFAWVPKTNVIPVTYPAAGTCTVDHTATPRDSTQSTTGVGCFYTCGQANNTPETCDGVDNDCDGCIDNGLTAPPICSTKGECALTTNTVACSGTNGVPSSVGWKCTYGPGIDVDGSGNLTATESKCDTEDNNCNGACDENYPDVPIASTALDGTACNNPRTAKNCSGGQGACQLNGAYACKMDKSAEECRSGLVVIGPNGDPSKASDEKCNGKDDDCNGLIDEATDAGAFKGWHDPMVKLNVALDPFTGQGAHNVWVYAYEASKPDATATSPGSLSTRACANAGVLPWSNVTLTQAQAACAAIKNKAGTSIGRLCSAWEWQQTCNGNLGSPTTDWSMSASRTTYQNLVCNDSVQEQRCVFGAGTTGCVVNGNCNSNNQCTCANAATDCPTGFSCTGNICVVTTNEQRCAPGASPSQCANTTCNANGTCPCNPAMPNNGDCSPGFSCSAGGICVGNGAWPTGSQGQAGAANQCFVDYGALNGGAAHDLSGNLQEWTSTPVTLASGSTASIAAGADSSHWVVNGLTGMLPSYVGAQLVITNATSAGNNGTFLISAVNSSTSVTIVNPSGAVQAGATVHWALVYNKLRGGNYATTSAPGEACEFDFDIAGAGFFNNDVGFRCCSDTDPTL